MDHQNFLKHASSLAIKYMERGEGGPFGAVIVKDGKIIAEGWNRVIASSDPTAHAEITAIRHASKTLGTFHLKGCILYTSCEPCPMCLGAIYWSHLDAVYYANTREDAANIGFNDKEIYQELALPMEKRLLPFYALPCEEAVKSFALWKDKQDKTPY
ncbi:MAG: CMP/dCMP deaminase zinc-binding [Rickettsiales bacterium]|jgi:tRNA(Arg) A34 adenosine deaminase TadA|nr:CMP/dCMP deaminase zinc-binding [Rickettsiales bacterium]